jgi:hypothetical protein
VIGTSGLAVEQHSEPGCRWLGGHCDQPGTDTVRGALVCREHMFASLQLAAR